MLPLTKLSQLKSAISEGRIHDALRIAAKFPRLGDDKEVITRAWAAYTNPRFYREVGMDPDTLVAKGIDVIRRRYDC